MLSLSADVTDHQYLADVGMALLDAALLAQGLAHNHPILAQLSEAGHFESLPDQRAQFLSTEEIRRAILRPISGLPEPAATIIESVISAAGRT